MTSDVRGGEGATFRSGLAVQVAYAGPTRAPAFNASVSRVGETEVVLDLRRLPNMQLPPQPGEPVVIVTRRQGNLVAFDARVLAVEYAPPLLVVTPPVEARRPERRGGVRAGVAIPVRQGLWLHPDDGALPIEAATLIDISEGGTQIRTLTSVEAGAIVRLSFGLDATGPGVEVQGMIVSVSAPQRGLAPRVHVQFIEVGDETREQIARFVERARQRKSLPA
jgi:c-di-GMP-binding flagellar brake protein YcgR